MDIIYEDFTQERIAKLRTQKGSSARDMSLSLGQNINYINQIESKRNLPSLQGLFYICEYLGITPQEFFDQGNLYPNELSEFIEEAKKLNEDSLGHLLYIMKKLNSRK